MKEVMLKEEMLENGEVRREGKSLSCMTSNPATHLAPRLYNKLMSIIFIHFPTKTAADVFAVLLFFTSFYVAFWSPV